MKKSLLVAVLAASFATPALPAESWFLSYNGKRCEITANKQPGWNVLGVYHSRKEAERGKHKNDKCQKD